jgi:hypothetical protein
VLARRGCISLQKVVSGKKSNGNNHIALELKYKISLDILNAVNITTTTVEPTGKYCLSQVNNASIPTGKHHSDGHPNVKRNSML